MKQDVCVIAAKRTPIGSFLGSLSSIPARALAADVVKSLLTTQGISPEQIDEVVFGQVLQAACGQNTARQAALDAGLSFTTPAYTVNQVCGSGLRAVIGACQDILQGHSTCAIAGGVESMSLTPHAAYMRTASKMGDAALKDVMLIDGLIDAFHPIHMGITAENVAKKYGITRESQDHFSYLSQKKATQAQNLGRFKEEITPISFEDKKRGLIQVEKDEHIRPETTAEKLAKLKPAFLKEGTVTAGNASGLNDGAAALLLMSAREAQEKEIQPLVFIRAWASCGVDPDFMGISPTQAIPACLKRAGWDLKTVDLIELNEAFAAQSLAVIQELGLEVEKVNVNGGAIALGHPIGASGARILVTLIHEMLKRNVKRGLASLCIGGGLGLAIGVERP